MSSVGNVQRREFANLLVMSCLGFTPGLLSAQESGDAYSYRVLATKKTSTMEKELNEAAEAGYRFEKAMGGNTLGGSEVVVIMSKNRHTPPSGRYAYKLLATSKTSTMQKELQAVGDEGFDYKDQTVFDTTFGGSEVVVILESDRQTSSKIRFEYKLLATTKT